MIAHIRCVTAFSVSACTWRCSAQNRDATVSKCHRDFIVDRRAICCAGAASLLQLALPRTSLASEQRKTEEGGLSDFFRKSFADFMESGMVSYEEKMGKRKQQLFSRIRATDVIADIGIGTGPNLKYYPGGLHVFGIEPNHYMWSYASEKAMRHGVNLKLLGGYAESIPLEDSSCDKVITTLTLCSVRDIRKAVQEILRILKPGGELLFIEHVIASPKRPILRAAQNILNPLQVGLADNCHLNRDTLHVLREATDPGFSTIKCDTFDAKFGTIEDYVSPIRPHISGFARKVGR